MMVTFDVVVGIGVCIVIEDDTHILYGGVCKSAQI
jgi:hypothetical protein